MKTLKTITSALIVNEKHVFGFLREKFKNMY
jgi:hypothetical protein